MPASPKVSIITVVFNAAKALGRTIESISGQTYRNIEYIIVDGASTDGTLDIIEANSGFITKWISEPDKGLYDAMNKGLALASGEYVWFINAGDLIANEYTTEKIMASNGELADIYYGETIIIDNNKNCLGKRRLQAPKKLNFNSFKWGMVVCHQSILIKRNITTNYNTEYKISADFDWVLNALKKAKLIENTNMILAAFEKGGLSGRNLIKSNWERFQIMINHYGIIQSLFYNLLMLFRLVYTYFKLGRL